MPKLVTFFLLISLFVGMAGGCQPATEIPSPIIDTSPRLAILSAFAPELREFRQALEGDTVHEINGRSFFVGTLEGHDVVLTLSGVSMVNAAMTTQTLVDHFNVRGILFSGIAGGVNPNLNIGDVVIPARWAQYQEGLFARETSQGWDTGWHDDDYGNYEMMFPQRVSVAKTGGRADDEEEIFWFEVDADMLMVARQVTEVAVLKECAGANRCLDSSPKIVVGGSGVSGPTFVDNASYRQWVWQTFQADALDMESAAVAHVAYVNQVPYIAFRSLSDLAGGGPGQNELPLFMDLAADNAAAVLFAFLAAWPVETPQGD